MAKKALVVGGNSGIGLAIAIKLLECYDHIYIIGKDPVDLKDIPIKSQKVFIEKTSFFRINLIQEDYHIFERIQDIECLIITVGFGRVARFEDLEEIEVSNLIKCNELSIIQILKKYYAHIQSSNDFYCAVMGSIAGHIVSPLFSVYGASKSGLCSFIETINIELSAIGCKNRVLDVSPGSIKGTKFSGGENSLEQLDYLVNQIVLNMHNRGTLLIPDYETTYKGVLTRYREDPLKFGLESYNYKLNRLTKKSQVVVGYLSGTFDLFHVGHLNLLKRAKQECDYLIVGVHRSGSWKGKETFIPFEERKDIVESIEYVDKVVESCIDDSQAYELYHYDKLFVGSDYEGSERFNRYEEFFKDKGVKIIYFPYTKGTSSTQIRNRLKVENGKEFSLK